MIEPDPANHPNVGRKIRYRPVISRNTDVETEGVVDMYVAAGPLFHMDMLSIKEVDHWIPAHECEFLTP
jgi:hypothetical protein